MVTKYNKFQRLSNLVQNLGLFIRLGTRPSTASFYHKGDKFIIQINGGGSYLFSNPIRFRTLAAQELAHELGHFIVAPKRRRFKKDYGIPDERNSRTTQQNNYWLVDELKAQFVERHLLRYYKIPSKKNYFKIYPAGEINPKLYNKALTWWNWGGKIKVQTILKQSKSRKFQSIKVD